MEAWLDWMMRVLALPEVGLSTVFFIAFVASTLVPLGSEPAVFGLVKLNPDMFWPAILAATAGASLGGALTWWMGYGAEPLAELPERPIRDPGHRRSEQAIRQRDVADAHGEFGGLLKNEAAV